jgi:hypothetical protein
MFPWKYFFSMKQERSRKKESCLHKGRFPYMCILLRFGNTLGCPSNKRMHSYGNLPYNSLSLSLSLSLSSKEILFLSKINSPSLCVLVSRFISELTYYFL